MVTPPQPDATPPGCSSNADCTEDPAAPLCAPDGACVACLSNADCLVETEPTCDEATRTCRPCAAGADCVSQVCDVEGGLCTPDGEIYYVDDGADCAAGDGTLAAPFCTILEANEAWAVLPKTLVYVFPGDYFFPPVPPSPPTYHGHAEARLLPALDGVCFRGGMSPVVLTGFLMDSCDEAIRIDAMGSSVIWYSPTIRGGDKGAFCSMGGMRIDGAIIEGTNQGFRCEQGATCHLLNSEVTFATGAGVIVLDSTTFVENTRIADIGYTGVFAVNATLDIKDAVIEHTGLASMDHGVHCNGPSCAIRRSRIRSATGAGIYVNGADSYVIENNAIVENGTIIAGELVNGGVVIGNLTPDQRFTNNTVYGNKAGAGEISGLRCAAGTTIANSIIWGNGEGVNQAEPGCIVTSSDIDQDTDPLYSNFRMDPMITNTTPGLIDEHLLPASPCIDRANSSAAVDDIDGEPREGPPDVGADEVTP